STSSFSSCAAAIFPSATICAHGNKWRKVFSAGRPAAHSDLFGVRLLSSPRRGLNECHGNAFQRTKSSGHRPSSSKVLQTMVAVGSEKPWLEISRLLVRRGATPE